MLNEKWNIAVENRRIPGRFEGGSGRKLMPSRKKIVQTETGKLKDSSKVVQKKNKRKFCSKEPFLKSEKIKSVLDRPVKNLAYQKPLFWIDLVEEYQKTLVKLDQNHSLPRNERQSADWLVNIAKCGFPVTKADLLDTIEKILKDEGNTTLFKKGRPGKKWYSNFLRRHPEISLRQAEGINKNCLLNLR
ncbi:hypothetical protein NQ318_023563 [Aromia moschata]|uniref:HTH CENPB-type domain-containing protein n=1 Tax=Aromia moschata TaxID=1265417 RepID=A0AAV8YNE1_9CUCU|nr:hypothetical protein NQ318_023563 [Aromia moschata]